MKTNYLEIPSIEIKTNSCSKCGLCSKICPVRIFIYSKKEIPAIQHTEECVLCGQCLGTCPTNSISHNLFDFQNFIRIQQRKPISEEQALAFLSQRRSLRNYTNEVPPKELLEKISQIAGFAPGSPHHRVGWERNITIVSGHENMKIVTEITSEYMQKMIKLLNSWMLKIIAKFSEAAKAGIGAVPSFEIALNDYKNGKDSITYNAPVAIFLHAPISSSMPQVDCDAACLQMQLYAEAFGLGSCWNGLIQGAAAGDHLRNFTKLSDFLKIPKGHKCYAAFTIGYPAVKLHSIPERKVDITWI